MTEIKRTGEMTIEEIEEVLEGMNWTEIHKARVFSDYGASIVLYTDGEFTVQDQSTYYRDPEAAGVMAGLSCWGQGNVDRTDYAEGRWERVRDSKLAQWDDDECVYLVDGVEVDETDWVETETGEIYDTERMLEVAIEDGEWEYHEEIDAVVENVREERRVQSEVYGA